MSQSTSSIPTNTGVAKTAATSQASASGATQVNTQDAQPAVSHASGEDDLSVQHASVTLVGSHSSLQMAHYAA